MVSEPMVIAQQMIYSVDTFGFVVKESDQVSIYVLRDLADVCCQGGECVAQNRQILSNGVRGYHYC